MSIYINDFSLNNALGHDKSSIISTIIEGKKYYQTSDYTLLDMNKTPVFRVEEPLPSLPTNLAQFNTRNNQLLLLALLQLEDTIKAHINLYGKNRVAVVFATSTSGIDEGIAALKSLENESLPESFNYYKQEMSSPSDFIQEYFELSGLSYTISSACSSGARAIIESVRLIENNLCDSVIVGASDSLNDLTLNGFYALEAIDQNHSKPFTSNRAGINIGEGAACFILSRQKSSLQIFGVGESSDAYHSSAPHPQGLGAILAMKQAISNAQISPRDIDYINLHGTGTLKNDEMEAKAICEVFEACDYRASSTKPYIGHCLGAAGLQELAICALLMGEFNPKGILPLQSAQEDYDPKLLPILLTRSNEEVSPRICMSNSYAFGGNNVSLIIGAI